MLPSIGLFSLAYFSRPERGKDRALSFDRSSLWPTVPRRGPCCRYPALYAMYKKAVASFWSVEEVDLSQDKRDWDSLSGTVDIQALCSIVLHSMSVCCDTGKSRYMLAACNSFVR